VWGTAASVAGTTARPDGTRSTTTAQASPNALQDARRAGPPLRLLRTVAVLVEQGERLLELRNLLVCTQHRGKNSHERQRWFHNQQLADWALWPHGVCAPVNWSAIAVEATEQAKRVQTCHVDS